MRKRDLESAEALRLPAGRSRHLRIPSEAVFVSMRPDGQRRLYALRPKPFREFDAWLARHRSLWEARVDRFGAALEKQRKSRRKEGLESWWGPVGFRVAVHAIDPRAGGTLHYDMIADAPEQVEAMAKMDRPGSHETRGTFSEIEPLKRMALTHVIDFLPGVAPYESTMTVQFFTAGEAVRMVVTLDPMHSEDFSQMQAEGFTSQLSKLNRRFAGEKG